MKPIDRINPEFIAYEKTQTEIEPIELGRIDKKGLLKAAQLADVFDRFTQKSPIIPKPDTETIKQLKKEYKERKKFGYDYEIYPDKIAYWEGIHDKNVAELTRLNSKLYPEVPMTDEELLTKIYSRLQELQHKAFNQVLYNEETTPGQTTPLQELINYVETIGPEDRQKYTDIERFITKLKEIQEGSLSIEEISEENRTGIQEFGEHSGSEDSIQNMAVGTIFYDKNTGYIAKVTAKKSGETDITYLFGPKRSLGTSGLGIDTPTYLTLEHVKGRGIVINYMEGAPNTPEQMDEAAKKLDEEIREEGIQRLATHSFDPGYLFHTLQSGNFCIPHLEGFQIEKAAIQNGKFPTNLRYVRTERPYFFMMFDAEGLEEEYPRSDPNNNLNKFHRIYGGIKLSNPNLKKIVLPKKFGEKIVKWLKSKPEEERQRIMGEKTPEELILCI
jgi:hypothetical protein